MKKISVFSAAIAPLFLVVGCGGGGGSDTPSTPSSIPVTNFPLQAAYKARVASGVVDNFAVSGSCSGTASSTTSSPVASSFEGASAFASTQTFTVNFTNCSPSSNAVTVTSYYDTNYTSLGSSVAGAEYSKYLTPPNPLPATVRVGDTGVYGTVTIYTDSTKSVSTGQRAQSYVIEADTPTTAIANFISKSYNSIGQLTSTQQSRYRIAGDGSLTTVSIDVQYSLTSTNHLVYTKQ